MQPIADTKLVYNATLYAWNTRGPQRVVFINCQTELRQLDLGKPLKCLSYLRVRIFVVISLKIKERITQSLQKHVTLPCCLLYEKETGWNRLILACGVKMCPMHSLIVMHVVSKFAEVPIIREGCGERPGKTSYNIIFSKLSWKAG